MLCFAFPRLLLTRLKKVVIQDLGSLHGTYLNDEVEKMTSEEPRELRNGDSIRFGVSVWRGAESFTPTTVKVGIVFDYRSVQLPLFRASY